MSSTFVPTGPSRAELCALLEQTRELLRLFLLKTRTSPDDRGPRLAVIFQMLHASHYYGLATAGTKLDLDSLKQLGVFVERNGITQILFVGCGAAAVESIVAAYMEACHNVLSVFTDVGEQVFKYVPGENAVVVHEMSAVDAVRKFGAHLPGSKTLVACVRPTPPMSHGKAFCPLHDMAEAGCLPMHFAQFGEICPGPNLLRQVFPPEVTACFQKKNKPLAALFTSDGNPDLENPIFENHYSTAFTEPMPSTMGADANKLCGMAPKIFRRWVMAKRTEGCGQKVPETLLGSSAETAWVVFAALWASKLAEVTVPDTGILPPPSLAYFVAAAIFKNEEGRYEGKDIRFPVALTKARLYMTPTTADKPASLKFEEITMQGAINRRNVQLVATAIENIGLATEARVTLLSASAPKALCDLLARSDRWVTIETANTIVFGFRRAQKGSTP